MIKFKTGIFTITFSIPGSFSLKDKRGVMRRIIGKARGSRRSYNISIAEVFSQDNYKQGVIAASVLSSDSDYIYKIFEVLQRFFDSFSEIEVSSVKTEIVSFNYTSDDMFLEEKYEC